MPQRTILACCRVSLREIDIFSLWIRHYAPHVDQMAVVIIAEREESTEALERMCQEAGVIFRIYRVKWFHTDRSMTALRKLVRDVEATWILHADSDEFLHEIEKLPTILSRMEAKGADYAGAWMADRLGVGGKLRSLEGIHSVEELEAAFPVRAAITGRLAKACSYKVCLTRWPHMGSIHHARPPLRRKARKRLTLEHYKWRTGLEERLRKRIRDLKASRFTWGGESRRLLRELAAHGRIRAERWLAPRSHRIHGWMDSDLSI